MTTRCTRCGSTAVEWALTDKGRPMLIDLEPWPDGNVVVSNVDRRSNLTVHVLSKAEMLTDTRQRRLAHAAYCGKPRPALRGAVATWVQGELLDFVPTDRYEPAAGALLP